MNGSSCFHFDTFPSIIAACCGRSIVAPLPRQSPSLECLQCLLGIPEGMPRRKAVDSGRAIKAHWRRRPAGSNFASLLSHANTRPRQCTTHEPSGEASNHHPSTQVDFRAKSSRFNDDSRLAVERVPAIETHPSDCQLPGCEIDTFLHLKNLSQIVVSSIKSAHANNDIFPLKFTQRIECAGFHNEDSIPPIPKLDPVSILLFGVEEHPVEHNLNPVPLSGVKEQPVATKLKNTAFGAASSRDDAVNPISHSSTTAHLAKATHTLMFFKISLSKEKSSVFLSIFL